jgi:cell division protein FtsN
LLNLLTFAYQIWIIEPAESIAPDFFAQDTPQLLQVERSQGPAQKPSPQEKPGTASDTGLEPAAAPPASSQEAPAANIAYQCFSVGPFAREPDASAVQRELQRRGALVKRTEETGQVWLGYWVQTTAYSSKPAAEAARKSLITRDMPDAYIIADGNEYRVSLGVFRLRASADEAIRRARSRGFATRTVERYQPGTNFRLLVRVAGGSEVLKGALPNVPGQILRSERVICPEDGI